jgi:hypothetical protein
MHNPFKHYEEHRDIDWGLTELAGAILKLQDSVKELREEVDYLAEFLDD